MSPFQPTVVRGFSKYTRMTISSVPAKRVRSALSFFAYSTAASGSWIEQGPMITRRRSSCLCMMRRIASRVVPIWVSVGVPAIGKNRMRCSGGGSGITSTIRSSSVRLVRSLLAYADSPVLLFFVMTSVPSLALTTKGKTQKKTAGVCPAVLDWVALTCLRDRLSIRRAVRELNIRVEPRARNHARQCSTVSRRRAVPTGQVDGPEAETPAGAGALDTRVCITSAAIACTCVSVIAARALCQAGEETFTVCTAKVSPVFRLL